MTTLIDEAPNAQGAQTLRAALGVAAFRFRNPFKQTFECPICRYTGPFRDVTPDTGRRAHAKCTGCGALERHRLQFLTMKRILSACDPTQMRMLHFAPEAQLQSQFRSNFGIYETADISMAGVDHHVDLQALPFASCSYDIVYASHVLEHIPDDRAAISEIRRILSPGGIAVLPVPLVSQATIEYTEPNPYESMHVRAPGPDYFDRFRRDFSTVDLHTSEMYPFHYQLFNYENRTVVNPKSPQRVAMPGAKHADVVPVCYA